MRGKTTFSWFRRVIVTLVLGGVMASAEAAVACSTPVYRYAMYRWFPAPYTLFYFHKDEPAEADRELHAAIEALGDYNKEVSANIDLVPIDLNKDPELKRLPPFLKKAWEEDNDGSLPAFMIVSPLGDTLHRGTFDAEELKAFVESPVRAEIMKLLKEGKTCVYVMLTSSDQKKNAAAEEVAQKAIKAVESGEIEFYDGELPYFGGEEGEEDEEATEEKDEGKKSKHSIGWLKVDRQSKPERWLVRSLLTVEHDLAELDEPMIFAVFGRGRALPPYLGKGITYDNLLDYFAEITGACSCTVKDQNPGMDLLTVNDWDSVAEAMAERYASDEGAQGSVADLFPQLIDPGDDVPDESAGDPETTDASDDGVVGATETDGSAEQPTSVDDDASADASGSTTPDVSGGGTEPSDETEPAETDESATADQPAKDGALGVIAGASEEPAAQGPGNAAADAQGDAAEIASEDVGQPAQEVGESPSVGTQNLWVTMGIGLGIAVVVLLLATVLLVRGK